MCQKSIKLNFVYKKASSLTFGRNKGAHKAELRHSIYACGKCMRFQYQLGQNKVVYNNQSKNAPQCVAL